MIKSRHSKSGAALTDLIFEVFRLNGRLLSAGDQLVDGLGLTSARWQVLGAVGMATAPGPVSHIARAMGLNRQGVQRIVNDLVTEGLLVFADNPHHRRAKLVKLTPRGQDIYAAAGSVQIPWVNELAKGLNTNDITAAAALLALLRARLAVRSNGDEG